MHRCREAPGQCGQMNLQVTFPTGYPLWGKWSLRKTVGKLALKIGIDFDEFLFTSSPSPYFCHRVCLS